MSTVELTTDNFDEVLSANDFVVIDFWASWCGPCRSFAPTFEKVSEAHPEVVFGKVDTEAQPDLAAAFQVNSIPTVALVRDQVVLYAQPGALPQAALEDLLDQAGKLDMDEVRKSVAAGPAPDPQP